MDLGEQILAKKDLAREAVSCPEWGEDGAPLVLYVRTPRGDELEAWDESNLKLDGTGKRVGFQRVGSTARLLVKIVETEDGSRVFADAQAPALAAKGGPAVERLGLVALRLAGRLEDSLKNSATTPPGASS